jgi:hypothetical protein
MSSSNEEFSEKGANDLFDAVISNNSYLVEKIMAARSLVPTKLRTYRHPDDIPLIAAIKLGYDDLAMKLIKSGEDIFASDSGGTGAAWACMEGKCDLLEEMLRLAGERARDLFTDANLSLLSWMPAAQPCRSVLFRYGIRFPLDLSDPDGWFGDNTELP